MQCSIWFLNRTGFQGRKEGFPTHLSPQIINLFVVLCWIPVLYTDCPSRSLHRPLIDFACLIISDFFHGQLVCFLHRFCPAAPPEKSYPVEDRTGEFLLIPSSTVPLIQSIPSPTNATAPTPPPVFTLPPCARTFNGQQRGTIAFVGLPSALGTWPFNETGIFHMVNLCSTLLSQNSAKLVSANVFVSWY